MDLHAVGVCLLAVLVYYNTLEAGFVYDDSRAILTNPDILPSTPLSNLLKDDFWGTPLSSSNSHGSYRPLCVLTFRLNHWFCGFRPWGYHLINVLLHSVATGLVLKTARTFLSSKSATVAASLFAVHPVHTEAVAGIVGRADIIACIFYLLSFITYVNHIKVREQKIKHTTICNEDRVKIVAKVKCSRNSNVSDNRRQFSEFCTCQHRIMKNKSPTFGNGLRISDISTNFETKMNSVNNSKLVIQWFHLCLSVLLAACSMLCKETGVTVLVVCVIYDFLHQLRYSKIKLKSQLGVSVAVIAISLGTLLYLRMHIMGHQSPVFATSDNPTARNPFLLTRTLTFLYLPVINAQLLIYPKLLSFDWSMDSVPRITTIFDPRNAITLFFYYIWFSTTKRALINVIRKQYVDSKFLKKLHAKRTMFKKLNFCTECHQGSIDYHSTMCRINNNNNLPKSCDCLSLPSAKRQNPCNYESFLLCLVFMIVPFMPATNLIFYVGFVIAERILYIPSVGYCFIIALGFHLLSKKFNKKFLNILITVLLLIFSGRTIKRNYDWKDEESLYRSGILVNPAKSYGNLGSVLSSQGRTEEAEYAFKMALFYRPNMADVHYNLGVLQQGRKEYEAAVSSYQMAIQYRPSLALAYLNLGQLLATLGKIHEAEDTLRRCSELDITGLKDPRTHETTRITALVNLGKLYADKGRYQDAVDVYREANRKMPNNYQPQMLYNSLGEALERLGHGEEAERWFKAALDASPNHVPAHLTYGKHLAKNRTRVLEAEQWFRKAQELAPTDPNVYTHFGQFLAELERYTEAAPVYLKAAQLAPDQYDLVVSAATALRQAGRHKEAEKVYRQAVLLRPKDASSHSNLGAMLHLNGKYKEAEEAYKEALKLEPNDVTTITNLKKLKNLVAT